MVRPTRLACWKGAVQLNSCASSNTKQALRNSEVHRWYRFVLAFPDHLVSQICDRFGATAGDLVLDPFCGTGTTLVECKKLGIDSIGIEANPSSSFASRVKTTWDLDPDQVRSLASQVMSRTAADLQLLTFSTQPLFRPYHDAERLKRQLLETSPAGRYFVQSGMLKRRWISEIPFYKVLAAKRAITSLDAPQEYQDLLLLALVAAIVENVANISFGPELYVVSPKDDADVRGAFESKVEAMASDLESASTLARVGATRVLSGDARECARVLRGARVDRLADYVITSPPYPTEKDYTRNTRLELVFLGYIRSSKDLRVIKQQMLRSHSKNIYKDDSDGRFVATIPEVQEIVDELRQKTSSKSYGFAKQYPRVILEYFGGMFRHLRSLSAILRRGGKCAYVVGDQRTYLQTYTPTGRILGIIAELPEVGLRAEDLVTWRVRHGTTGSGRPIEERVLILTKP